VIAGTPLELLARLVSDPQTGERIPETLWPEVIDLALQHGLGPMVLWSLSAINYSGHVDYTRLRQVARQNALREIAFSQAQQQIIEALDQAHIPSLWLKGAALARTVYPQPALRPMSDLDVLVPYEQREKALAVVQGIGYNFYHRENLRLRSSRDESIFKPAPHHYHLKGGIANSTILELHFQLLGQDNDLLTRKQLRYFWERTQTLRLDNGLEFDILTPEAHLLYLCAHAILQHTETPLYLLRFFDLHQIITQIPLDWNAVIDQAVEFGWTLAVERALGRCVAHFSTPVPGTVFQALVVRRSTHEDTSRVWRFQGSGNQWERVRGQMRRLSMRDQVRLIVLICFPPASYMRQRYQIKSSWPAWPYYFYRWFDQARDIVSSTWKHLTGQYR
jgi:hypothetical protein